jgi:ABC-type transport system involved in multi-copper enzyme maturation permease subunit
VSVPSPNAKPTLSPSLWGLLRGLWLFSWKSKLSWRRMPILIVGLVTLPFLVSLVTPSPNTWKRRDTVPVDNQANQLWQFERRLRPNYEPLTQEQRDQLHSILQSEYARLQTNWHELNSPETSVEEQRHIILTYFNTLLPPAKDLLDDDQYVIFRIWNRESLSRNQNHINEPMWNRTSPFYHLLIDFYFFIILPLGCVRSTGGLIRDDLQSDTLGFLLTRPIKRAALLLLKFFCEVTWLEFLALVESLLIFGVGHWREVPSLRTLVPLFLATQFLAVLAWSALGVFLGQITKRYLAVALVYGLVVELGIGAIPTNINSLSLMRHLQTLLSNNRGLQTLFQWGDAATIFPAGMLLLAAALFLTIASLLFTFLEYHAAEEMRK